MSKRSFKAKFTLAVLILTILPVLSIGVVGYLGTQGLKKQMAQAEETQVKVIEIPKLERLLKQQQSLVILLLIVTALLSAAIAIGLVNYILRPILRASKTSATLVNRLRRQTPLHLLHSRQDEILTLETNLNLIAKQLPELLWKQEAADEPFQVLMSISRRLWESFSEENVLRTTVEEIRQALKTDRVVIFRFEGGDGEGTFIAESVAPVWPKTLWATINDSCFADYTQIYQNDEIEVINDIYKAGFSDDYLGLLERFAVKASIIAPIIRNNQLFGLFIAHQCSNPRVWQQSEIHLFMQIATQVGFALDHARLLEQIDMAAEQSQLFTDITLCLRESLKEENILKITVAELRKVLNTDRVIVYSFDSEWYGTVVAESVVPGFPKALWAKIKDPCFVEGYVESYQAGRVQATNNIYEAGLTECHLQQLEPFAVKANLVAPILKDDKLFGLLIAHQCSSPRVWQQPDIDLFAQIALQVGFALDHARLLAQVEQAYQYAQLESLQQREQQETLQRQISETIKESQVTLKNLSTEVLNQIESLTAIYHQMRASANSAQDTNSRVQQAERQQQQVRQIAQSSHESVNELLDKMSIIQNTFTETAEKILSLDRPARKLSEIISLISNIVSQVKLQALSAELEATRIGEPGQELFSIAKKANSLTRQLETELTEVIPLIAEIQGKTSELSTVMKIDFQQLNIDTQLIEETRLLSYQLTNVNAQVSKLMEEISQAVLNDLENSDVVSQSVLKVEKLMRQASEQSILIAESFDKLVEFVKLEESKNKF